MTVFGKDQVEPPYLKLGWLGHAMFLLQDDKGTRVVTDPYDPSIGYPLPQVDADVVLVSHDHYDHSNTSAVGGRPAVIKNPGVSEAAGITFKGMPTYHDGSSGAERGPNLVFHWEMGGLRVAHLGDLGHMLSPAQAEELGGVDVLMLPVGGTYTIDGNQASRLVKALSPRIAIPMHYKTDRLTFPITGVDDFASDFQAVLRAGKRYVYLSREDLPDGTTILLLDYLA